MKNLFKGIGVFLSKSAKALVKPIKTFVISYATKNATKSIKDEVQANVLGYLAQNYEDEACAKLKEYVAHFIRVAEDFIKVLPDIIESPFLHALREIESILLKTIESIDIRLDEMKRDGKITQSELDDIMSMDITQCIADIARVLLNIKGLFAIQTKEVEEEEKITTSSVKELKEEPVFSAWANNTLAELKEKHKE